MLNSLYDVGYLSADMNLIQVLVRLCSHTAPAEELARKDDLTLLFSAITSWCPQYNVMWRKSAAEVLMTLSRHGLTLPVVSYIHSKSYFSSQKHHSFLSVLPVLKKSQTLSLKMRVN